MKTASRTTASVAIVLGLAMSSATVAAPAARVFGDETAVHAVLRQHLNGLDSKAIKVTLGFADLNGDGRPDALAYVSGRDECGSGGCSLYVLQNDGRAYRIVTRTTVTRPPIRALQQRSHGWSDLGVSVSGGGLPAGYEAVLRFDGKRYPGNPTTVPPQKAAAAGRTLIADEATAQPL